MALFDGRFDWYDMFIPGSNLTPFVYPTTPNQMTGNLQDVQSVEGKAEQRQSTSAEKEMTDWNYTNMIRDSQRFEHDEAELNRKWQEEMSNSAYQRAVADMQKAGLNPAMMFANGAQMAYTGTGAQAHSTINTTEYTRGQYVLNSLNSASKVLTSIGDFIGSIAPKGIFKK